MRRGRQEFLTLTLTLALTLYFRDRGSDITESFWFYPPVAFAGSSR